MLNVVWDKHKPQPTNQKMTAPTPRRKKKGVVNEMCDVTV
jgi:hypothetical protein